MSKKDVVVLDDYIRNCMFELQEIILENYLEKENSIT